MTDLPERSVLIAGLDDWVGDRELISEPRLSAKVRNPPKAGSHRIWILKSNSFSGSGVSHLPRRHSGCWHCSLLRQC